MTTPITKQWLQKAISEMEAARDDIPFGLDEDGNNTLLALKMALTSLSAEPVGEVSDQPDGLVMDGMVHLGGSRTHRVVKGLNKMKRLPLGTKFYTAPPAPVVDAEPAKYHIGDTTMQNVFKPTGMTGISDLQAVFDQVEIALNSPVIPDGWIAVSERMPPSGGSEQRYVLAADFRNHYWPNIPNTQVGVYGDWFNDGNPTWDDGDGEDLHLKEVTHWMPLPAAPQQEGK